MVSKSEGQSFKEVKESRLRSKYLEPESKKPEQEQE